MLVADTCGKPWGAAKLQQAAPHASHKGNAQRGGMPREGGHQTIRAVGVDLILTIRRICGYDTTIPLFLAKHPCWRGILEGVMDGKAKETVPLFLFIGEYMTSEANRKGRVQDSAQRVWLLSARPASPATWAWRSITLFVPTSGSSSNLRFPLSLCGHHAVGIQAHSTVAFPEQPPLIHGREGVTTQLPKHKQMRSKILTCFNRKEGGEGLWVRDVHGNTTLVGEDSGHLALLRWGC